MRGRVARNGDTPASTGNVANIITVVRILLAPLFIWLLLADDGELGPIRAGSRPALFIVAIATDGVDGLLARRQQPRHRPRQAPRPDRRQGAHRRRAGRRCRSSASCGGGSRSSSWCARSASRCSASSSLRDHVIAGIAAAASSRRSCRRSRSRSCLVPLWTAVRRLDALGQRGAHGGRRRAHGRERASSTCVKAWQRRSQADRLTRDDRATSALSARSSPSSSHAASRSPSPSRSPAACWSPSSSAVPGPRPSCCGGVVAYNTDSSTRVLGVDAELLAEHGPVDPEVAVQMAEGVRAGSGGRRAAGRRRRRDDRRRRARSAGRTRAGHGRSSASPRPRACVQCVSL